MTLRFGRTPVLNNWQLKKIEKGGGTGRIILFTKSVFYFSEIRSYLLLLLLW